MKRVCTSESLAEIGHWRNVLEQAGIACTIKNEQLAGALGEIPFLDCLPELWVIDDAESARAEALIHEQRAAPVGAPWRCPRCGEHNEAQFAACWRCAAHDGQD
jgi:hypothetical protein